MRRGVLRAFIRSGLIEPDATANVRAWQGWRQRLGGSIRVVTGLERLRRYCA
jgi:hypothetical protein